MSNQKDTTTEESCNIKLDGIWLENEFPKSQRCKRLIHEFGFQGYYALTLIWGELSASHADYLDLVDLEIATVGVLAPEVLPKFLDFCVASSLLDVCGLTYFSNTIRERKERRLAERARKNRGNLPEKSRKISGKSPENLRKIDGKDAEKNAPLSIVLSPKSKVLSHEEDVTLPALPPEPPKPKFNPEGKTKYLDWVYLDERQFARVQAYYQEKGLDTDDFKEAVRALDGWFANNPKMRLKRTDDSRALMGWPLDEALKRKANLQRIENMQQRGGAR